MLQREKEKAFLSTTFLDLMPSYPAELAAKPYPLDVVPEFQKFAGRKGNTKSMWFASLI